MPRFFPRSLLVSLALAAMLGACTPQAALIASLIPQGTLHTLMGNLERVSDTNRVRVAELERNGRWSELAKFAETNLDRDRSNADWWLIAGYARSQLAEHAAAGEAFSQVIRLEPDNPGGWHLLAQSYRARGEPQRAVNTLNNALLALRDSPLTFYLLGESYTDLRHHEQAAAAYEGALKIDPQYTAAWLALALTYTRLGRTADASAAAARLEKLDPQLARRLHEAIAAHGARPR